MANVRPMWLTGGMSGRADRTSNTYTKQSSITGKTIAVTLRNPVGYDKQGAKQIAQQNKFHALAKGVSIFYRRISAIGASAEDQALFKSLVSFVRGQHRYGTVRGYLQSKCATVNEDLTQVKIVYRDHEETINVSFQARSVVTRPNDEPDFSGSTDGGSTDNSGSTDSGNQGSTENPSAGESFTIAAGVGADGIAAGPGAGGGHAAAYGDALIGVQDRLEGGAIAEHPGRQDRLREPRSLLWARRCLSRLLFSAS